MKGGYRDEFLDSLAVSINDRIEIIKSSIDLTMENNLSDSVQTVFTNRGKAMMGSIRSTILTLLKERRNSRDDSYRALEQINAEIDTVNEVGVLASSFSAAALRLQHFFLSRRWRLLRQDYDKTCFARGNKLSTRYPVTRN